MGRLIDADKLIAQVEAHEIIKEFSITEYECGHNEGICIAVDDIEDAETIEAIPVPWIEAKMKNLVSPGCKDVLDWLLAEWREEQNNGIDKS